MTILIKITKEVLEKTKFCGTDSAPVIENCAIAYAVREIFPNAKVGWDIVKGIRDYSILVFGEVIPLPPNARNFISVFDSASVQTRVNLPEFSFEITIPPSVLERISIGEAYRVLSESKTLELVHP